MRRHWEWSVSGLAILFVFYTVYLFFEARGELKRVHSNTDKLQILTSAQVTLDSISQDLTRINNRTANVLGLQIKQLCQSNALTCDVYRKWIELKKSPTTPALITLRWSVAMTIKDLRAETRKLAVSLSGKWHQLLAISIIGCLFAIISSFLLVFLRRRSFLLKKQNVHLSKLSRELEQTNAKLKEAGKEREAFAHLISHEMKTPLNIISGMAVIMKGEQDPELRGELADEIRLASRSLARIIDNTLDYEHYYKGDIEVHKEPFSLHSLCGLVYRSIGLAAEKKNIQIELVIDPAVEDNFSGDAVLLSRVLMQLMSNAVKYTEKGRVELAVGLISESESSQVLEFKVTDTGIGVAKARMNEIFDSYNQLKKGFSRSTDGIGLGLNVTQALLGAMGTSLHMQSVQGHGSQFYFTLPIGLLNHREITAEQIESLAGTRVLIVEDNRLNLLILRKYLDQRKFYTDTATTHQEALSKLVHNEYDCVLLDLQIPGKDGFEILEQARAEKPGFITPVLAVTAASIQFVHDKISKYNFFGFVSKPIREQELLSRIYSAVKDKN